MEKLSLMPNGASKEKMKTSTGVRKPTSPLHRQVIPGFRLVSYRPHELMHLEALGLLPRDIVNLIVQLVKVGKFFTLDEYHAELSK